jgi:type I restriction enzyme R subunit
MLLFIAWDDWRANTFQVTSEYTVSEAGGPTIRIDLVLFVNGIPLGVIEVKASHVSAEQGVSQQIRNQKTGEGVPALFYSAQLLVAANGHDPRYGTVGTPRKLWSAWKEKEDTADFISTVVNRPLDTAETKRIALDFEPYMGRHHGLMEERRFVTPLDETLVGLCRPERFIRLVRNYMLFDGPQKKVARYQQVLTVENLLMTDLDDQISKTFKSTGQEPKRAATGEHLLLLIENKTPVITTVIHKFRAGLNKRRVADDSPDIFVLVDESHRSQYGNLDSLHARMREVLPNACFIAFTGTPIAKKEKSTFAKFGELVQPSYSMRSAVEDKAVVPLLYEGREVVTDVDEAQIDRWFEIHTRDLSDEQRADLKRKMSRAREIEGIESRLQSIAPSLFFGLSPLRPESSYDPAEFSRLVVGEFPSPNQKFGHGHRRARIIFFRDALCQQLGRFIRLVIGHRQLRLGQTHDDLVIYHFDAEEVWLGIHCVQPQLSSLSESSCAASGGNDLITGLLIGFLEEHIRALQKLTERR